VILTRVETLPVKAFDAVSLFASATIAVNEYGPAAVGVPLMAPLVESRLVPAGSEPPVMDQV
jgi:hypothetical protein